MYRVRVTQSVVRGPRYENDPRPGLLRGGDLLGEPSRRSGILGDYPFRSDLVDQGYVGFLGERPLGADEVLSLESQRGAFLHRCQGRQNANDDPLLVIGNASVFLGLFRAGCDQDDAFGPRKELGGLLHASDDDHSVLSRGVPKDPHQLGAGGLARLSDVLGDDGSVRMGGVYHDGASLVADLPRDAFSTAAASHLDVVDAVPVHHFRAEPGRDAHMDVRSGLVDFHLR